MPPRRRAQAYTQESVDQQLQQIHLLDPSSATENLEQLGPIIKQIHAGRQQEAFLRTVNGLIDAKDQEIERICSENYRDFISSVTTLFTVKDYTENMKRNISNLDASVAQLGKGVVDKKRSLLASKKTAGNMDEAVDALQACLRVLDVVHRVGEMVKEGKYWSALRCIDDIQSLPPPMLLQTPFYQHLLSSLPSLRGQIKDAVTASMKQWLLEIRNNSGTVGRIAQDGMEVRARRWRSRREKDPMFRLNRVGSAVEVVTYEKTEFDVLNNEELKIDFRPLFECIHIYTALDSLEELRRSYQADRKAQSDLVLPEPLPLASLTTILQEIAGFFIVESHVLETTGTFRSEREVEELWTGMVTRLKAGIEWGLQREKDPDAFLRIKESMVVFLSLLDNPYFQTTSLNAYIMVLFGRYAELLEGQFSRRFDSIIQGDDHLPMMLEAETEVAQILEVVWVSEDERRQIQSQPLPVNLPWSQTFYLCCQDIRGFIQKFYAFVEGVSQHHRNIDELLGQSLDSLITQNISSSIGKRLANTSTLTQVAQIVTNLEHFQVACTELERSLTNLRSSQRGGSIKLSAANSIESTLTRALGRISSLINSKLNDFFEVSEYDWTPVQGDSRPSEYLDELISWLMTVTDSLAIKDAYKDEAYRGAVTHISEALMDFLTGRNVPMLNEFAISNILNDVDFIEEELKRAGRPHLCSVFQELRATTSIPLNNTVSEFMVPANRRTSFSAVRPKRLQALLEKLAKFGSTKRDSASRQAAERRRKEAEEVGKLFPG
ncbi:exocyst complex subunit Sec15-like protein, partial [Cylindrobasidium torrendii FP15055 ss-10]